MKVNLAPFQDAKALYQAVLREAQGISMAEGMQLEAFVKDFICIGFSSPLIEMCLWKCLERCTYNSGKGDLKIDSESFEPVACREDYIFVCAEVAQENILPFVKSLYVEFKKYMSMTATIQK